MKREATLRRVSLAALAALACICMVVFAVHRSADPRLLGWSERYIFGAVLPLLAVIAAQAVLVSWPPLSRTAERCVALASGVGGVLVLGLGVQVLPLYELPPMALFLGLMALALAGDRAFRNEGWLISYVALSALCLVLFVPEALRLVTRGRIPGDRARPHWGDAITFRYLFPEAEPFIGEGGRLQPNLDLEVYTDSPGQGGYRMRTNAAGFRNDRDIPTEKEADEIRVLSLGDSFSGGYGVDQNRFVGSILERGWPRTGAQRITVLNAEVSDPAYALLYLQRYGIHYSPDVVLFGYVENDSHQAFLPFGARGIFSLDAEGTVQTHDLTLAESARRVTESQQHFAQYLYPRESSARLALEAGLSKRPVAWLLRLTESVRDFLLLEPVFRAVGGRMVGDGRDGELTFISTASDSSRTAGRLRLIDFASNWGMLYKHGDEMTAPLYANLFTIFRSMKNTAAKHGATFVLVYFSRREQVQPQDWKRFHTFWNLDPDDFDLDREASRLGAFCEAEGIPFVDTTAALRAAAPEHRLYLPNDTHFNAHGQAVAAQVILEFMAKRTGQSVATAPSAAPGT